MNPLPFEPGSPEDNAIRGTREHNTPIPGGQKSRRIVGQLIERMDELCDPLPDDVYFWVMDKLEHAVRARSAPEAALEAVAKKAKEGK